MKLYIPSGHFYATILMALLFMGSLSSSCKKEYIDRYNTVAGDTIALIGDTHIESFAIHEFSADTILNATIQNDSIIVYWPSYKPLPDSISPQITLPDSAAISPVSGKKIIFESGMTYIVTSGAGTKKIYKLIIDIRQPLPWFSFVYANKLLIGTQITFGQTGDWFLADTAKTKVILIAAESRQEYEAQVINVTSAGPSFFVPVAPEGKYDLKIINGVHTVFNQHEESRNNLSVEIAITPTLYTYQVPTTFKAGDIFTFRAASGHLVAQLDGRLSSNNAYYPFEVIDRKTDRIKVKVPDTMPKGTYNRFYVRNSSGTAIALASHTFTITD